MSSPMYRMATQGTYGFVREWCESFMNAWVGVSKPSMWQDSSFAACYASVGALEVSIAAADEVLLGVIFDVVGCCL